MGSDRADLIRTLFALNVEIGSETKSAYKWATDVFDGGTNLYGDALSLAIWEIVFENDLFDTGGEPVPNLSSGDFSAEESDARTTAQGWLSQLDVDTPLPGPGFKVWALTSPGKQDMAFYCEAGSGDPPPIPEPAAVVQLLGLGAMLGLFAIRRRGLAAMLRISRSLAPTGWRGG